jgi:hypothetical protein
MISTRVHRCLEPGMSIVVSAVDAHGAPSCCRATALSSTDDLRTVTVYLPVATSHDTIENLALTRRLAIAAMFPLDHFATQIKGVLEETRLAGEEEAPFIRDRLEAFATVLDAAGIPKRLTRSLGHWPAFAVRIRVEQVFDQTPGPKAGARLQ